MFTGVYIIFLISAQKHRLWVLKAVLTSTHSLCFEQKYEKISEFLSGTFQFLVVKLSIYLNRCVLVMDYQNFQKKKPNTVNMKRASRKELITRFL